MAAKGQASVHLLEKYRGMSFIERIKKAAMEASNDGECWWVHNYIFSTLTWRGRNDNQRT